MLQPQEVVVGKLLPTVRARVAQILLEDHHLRQVEIAKLLGLTQAAVSHYHTRSRGLDKDVLRHFPELEAFAQDIAARVQRGMPLRAQIAAFNTMAETVSKTDRFCQYHKKIASLEDSCDVCFEATPKTR